MGGPLGSENYIINITMASLEVGLLGSQGGNANSS